MTKPYVFLAVAGHRTGYIPTILGVSTSDGSRIVSISAIFGFPNLVCKQFCSRCESMDDVGQDCEPL